MVCLSIFLYLLNDENRIEKTYSSFFCIVFVVIVDVFVAGGAVIFVVVNVIVVGAGAAFLLFQFSYHIIYVKRNDNNFYVYIHT